MVHDFGTVLTRGEDLHYDFLLENPTDRPLRFLRAMPLSPCCSSIRGVPKVLLPGETARVPTRFRSLSEEGPKRVEFLLETDSVRTPVWRLVLEARLVPSIETIVEEGGQRRLLVDEGGHQVVRVVTRREREGPGSHESPQVDCSPPIRVALLHSSEVATEDGPIVERHDWVRVDLPALAEPGPKRGEFQLVGPPPLPFTVPIRWEVVSPLRVSPPLIVLRKRVADQRTKLVVKAEDGRPFRVLGLRDVEFATLAGPLPSTEGTVHRLELSWRVGPATAEARSIHLITDHARQGELAVPLVWSP